MPDGSASLARHGAGDHAPDWLALIEVYRQPVIDTIPGGVTER